MIDQIPRLSQSRVLVVGDLMVDRYWQGSTTRISPEAPIPVVKINDVHELPGGAGNVACNVASLGAISKIVGVIGDDDNGDIITKSLSDRKIEQELIINPHVATIAKLRVISQHQQLIRLDFEDDPIPLSKEELAKKCEGIIKDFDVVILSDYAKGVLDDPSLLIKIANKNDIPVIVDPKGKNFAKYKGSTILTPNKQEFEKVMGSWRDIDELTTLASAMIAELDLQALLITLGADGMVLVDQNNNISHIPAHTEDVYDVTGAGDTVIAVLGCAIAQKISFDDSMMIANLAASLVVKKLGAQGVTVTELLLAAMEHEKMDSIISQQDLRQLVIGAKKSGLKIVMTNGCFDVLHAGHVSYLKHAKQLGDKLIVAVNSDDSVKRLKGDNRPIHALKHRQLVLSELQSVDWVVSFDEDTPKNIIDLIVPDVLVKGGDYTVDTIVGADVVLKNGGTVKVLNFEDDLSTTNILNKL